MAADTTTPSADHVLITRTREGDERAFAELWSRHAVAGHRYARHVSSSFDPDDLVAEAFLQILRALRNGHGPTTEFRPYLLATIRNQARTWGRTRHEIALDDLDLLGVEGTDASDEVLRTMEARATALAFRSLPARWQRVLWLIEVEHLTPAQVARLIGSTPNGVSSLVFRAREGLRDAWVQMQVAQEPCDRDCTWSRQHLGAYARHHLSVRHQAKMVRHLTTCARCAAIARETRETVAGMLTSTQSEDASYWPLPSGASARPRSTEREDSPPPARPGARRGSAGSTLAALTL